MADKIDTLKNLRKIARHKVDEVQKELAQTLATMTHLADKISHLESCIEKEEVAAADDLAMRGHFERFEKRTRDEIKKLEDEIRTLRQHEAHLRAQLAEHFAEEKRYQILLERKQQELQKEQAKKTQAQLDEIAAVRQENQD